MMRTTSQRSPTGMKSVMRTAPWSQATSVSSTSVSPR
jgi:hypothetical protein